MWVNVKEMQSEAFKNTLISFCFGYHQNANNFLTIKKKIIDLSSHFTSYVQEECVF